MKGTKVFSYLEVMQQMGHKTGMGSETAQGCRNLDGEWRLGRILAVRGFVIAFLWHLVLTKSHIAIANSVGLFVVLVCYFRHFQVS